MSEPSAPSPTYNDRVTMVYDRADGQEALFSAAECEGIIACTSTQRAILKNDAFHHPEAVSSRRHEQFRFPHSTSDAAIRAFQQKLEAIVHAVNRQVWRFEVTGFSDLLVHRYQVGDEVTLHCDLEPECSDVKLVVVVQLSPASAYRGGRLEMGFAPATVASQQQGGLAVLPAWVPHRVTPITAGTRYTAVCNALGPSFR